MVSVLSLSKGDGLRDRQRTKVEVVEQWHGCTLVFVRTYRKMNRVRAAAKGEGDQRDILLSATHSAIVCISALSVGLHSIAFKFGGAPHEAGTVPRQRSSTNRRRVLLTPDMVKPSPDYLVPYRDRSLKQRGSHTDSSRHAVCPLDKGRA
jgi:hypothetical protein